MINNKKPQCFTSEQARTFVKATKGHELEALFTIALATGMRRGELLALRWSDLDVETRSVHIQRTLSSMRGTFVASKCERTLTLPSPLLTLLCEYCAHQSDLVFCKSQGPVLDPTKLHRELNTLLSSVQLSPMRFHNLRCSTISLLISLGVPIQVIEVLLGISPRPAPVHILSPVSTVVQTEALEKLYRLLW